MSEKSNKPTATDSAEIKFQTVEQQRKAIREDVKQQNFEKAATKLVNLAAKNEKKEISQADLTAILGQLKKEEILSLANVFLGKDETGQLRSQLLHLSQNVSGSTVSETTASPAENPASQILASISGFVTTLGPQVNAMAEKIGFKIGEGKATTFLTNFFADVAAKLAEQFSFMFNRKGFMETACALRIAILNYTGRDAEDYRDCYTILREEATTSASFKPPSTVQVARKILKQREDVAQVAAAKKAAEASVTKVATKEAASSDTKPAKTA